MHTTHLPPSKRSVVSFTGVDWEEQKEKLEKRRDKRVKKMEEKQNQKTQKNQLRCFLETASGDSDLRDFVFDSAVFKELPYEEKTRMDLSGNVDSLPKVKHVLANFEAMSDELRYLLAFRMAAAIREGMYSDPSSPSNESSSTNGSLVSDLTEENGLNAYAEPVENAFHHELYHDPRYDSLCLL